MADDPDLSAHRIAFEPGEDIDSDASADVKDIDERVFSCISLAEDALAQGFGSCSDFERDQIKSFVNGMRHSHKSIRKLLTGERSSSSIDALAIARLQVENVFTACYLLESETNVRLFVKNAWKSKYVRFLLHRLEFGKMPRFREFYDLRGPNALSTLQSQSFISDEERKTIEVQQLAIAKDENWRPVPIPGFPTPAKVVKKIGHPDLKRVLARLNAEYEFLCSFAHGENESVTFRAVVDPRSPVRHFFSTSEVEDFYQRQVLEPSVYYSALSVLMVATEVAAVRPDAVELRARLADAWGFFLKMSLWFHFAWKLRARRVLGVLG